MKQPTYHCDKSNKLLEDLAFVINRCSAIKCFSTNQCTLRFLLFLTWRAFVNYLILTLFSVRCTLCLLCFLQGVHYVGSDFCLVYFMSVLLSSRCILSILFSASCMLNWCSIFCHVYIVCLLLFSARHINVCYALCKMCIIGL